jgi:acetyl-CoA C-acetyltransferase
MNRDVLIVSGARTAIGDYGGSLKDFPPTELAALCVREAVQRAGIDAGTVELSVFGNVIHTEPRDMYLARVASVESGLKPESTALTLNRLCGSGLQAIITAAQAITLGDATVAVAGGAESMSRAGYLVPGLRWGQRMGNGSLIDMMTGVLTDPFSGEHMGITAENVAVKAEISREEQDRFAVESHQRAGRAQAAGRFEAEIVPVMTKGRKSVLFKDDEHVRGAACYEDFSGLKPVFKKEGSVTVGNASGLNDGAAAVILMDSDTAARQNVKALGRVVAYGHAGIDPSIMGLGPVQAVTRALERARLSLSDIDVIESNEAFAAQACGVAKALGLDVAKTNPNGGAIAFGHPIGATGAIITVKALYELQRSGGRYGLVTMCIGGGQGIALVVEALR